jgi:alpha-1,3-fucosyltransferase
MLCNDYVSEKLYNALSRNIIPIVFGGVNYTHFAPPKSFIDANQFESIDDLKKELIRIKSDMNEYFKYFWWKGYYKVEKNKADHFCSLCQSLHRDKLQDKVKVYKDIYQWWNDNQCQPESHILTKRSLSDDPLNWYDDYDHRKVELDTKDDFETNNEDLNITFDDK